MCQPLVLTEKMGCEVSCKIRQDEDMPQEIWCGLPQEVLERILLFLPVSSLCRFCAVSKRWKSLVASLDFVQVRERVNSSKPCFMFAGFMRTKMLTMVDNSLYGLSYEWHPQPKLNFLPWLVFLVSSSEGLLLCESRQHDHLVCNPVTRTWRAIPAVPDFGKPGFPARSCLITDTKTRAFKLVLARIFRRGRWSFLQIFDSRLNRWERPVPPPPEFKFSAVAGSVPVFYNGLLYISGRVLNQSSSEVVLTYSIEEGIWSRLQAHNLPGIQIGSFVICGGQLLMLRYEADKHSMRIWELHQARRMWVTVVNVPSELLNGLEVTDPTQEMRFAGLSDLVYFTSNQVCKMLVCDYSRRVWFWLTLSAPFGHLMFPVLPFTSSLDPRL